MSEQDILIHRKNKFLKIGRNNGFVNNTEDTSTLSLKKNKLTGSVKSGCPELQCGENSSPRQVYKFLGVFSLKNTVEYFKESNIDVNKTILALPYYGILWNI